LKDFPAKCSDGSGTSEVGRWTRLVGAEVPSGVQGGVQGQSPWWGLGEQIPGNGGLGLPRSSTVFGV